MVVDKPGEVERVVIFDIMGKRVQVIENPLTSDLRSMGASLKPGTYIIQVNGVNWLKTFKVVKID